VKVTDGHWLVSVFLYVGFGIVLAMYCHNEVNYTLERSCARGVLWPLLACGYLLRGSLTVLWEVVIILRGRGP
jgi:hypothetical protein